jgi:ADP-heptose:LPS heptosyltransferase
MEPTQNREFFYQKWIASGRLDNLVNARRPFMKTTVTNILVRRGGANGDVLVAAAVCKPLKEKFPGSKLYFSTQCESVLKDHPYIDEILRPEASPQIHFQIVVDLDLAYERRPKTNILQAYADEAGVSVSDCELFFRCDFVGEEYEITSPIVIHAGKTAWVGRNWNTNGFSEIARRLKEMNFPVICVGSLSDSYVPCDVDLRGKISLYQLATVIKNSCLFIGIDSLPMHIAQAVKADSVCFFGSIRPETRLIGNCVTPVSRNDLPCIGCHHRKPSPSTVTDICETSDLQCEQLEIEHFWKVIQEKLCVKN